MNALVLAAMSIKPLTVEQIYERAEDVFGEHRVRNALSSLRSAGHVVSEPKPGSRKEKLWRLAVKADPWAAFDSIGTAAVTAERLAPGVFGR